MATAFYGTMILKSATSSRVQVEKFNHTDVTLAYATFASNGGLTYVTAKEDCFLTDIVLNIVAAGTTLTFKLWLDSTDTNIQWVQSLSFPTINNRMFNMNPVKIRKGTMIQLQGIT